MWCKGSAAARTGSFTAITGNHACMHNPCQNVPEILELGGRLYLLDHGSHHCEDSDKGEHHQGGSISVRRGAGSQSRLQTVCGKGGREQRPKRWGGLLEATEPCGGRTGRRSGSPGGRPRLSPLCDLEDTALSPVH